MAKYTCPYCETSFSSIREHYREHLLAFDSYVHGMNRSYHPETRSECIEESRISIKFYLCPECEEYSIEIQGMGDKVSQLQKNRLFPFGTSKNYPDYIPEPIRNDYKEACLIKDLSPKASATLSRRCLQGMIRDYWNVSERNLYKEIDAIKDKITTQQWSVLDAVRKIGNIGAHMEKDINIIVDIDPDEAEKLIKLIEYLVKEWYINRHETEQLFADILKIDSDKAASKLSK